MHLAGPMAAVQMNLMKADVLGRVAVASKESTAPYVD